MSLYIQEKEEVAEAQKLLQSSAEMDMIFSSTVRASMSDDSVCDYFVFVEGSGHAVSQWAQSPLDFSAFFWTVWSFLLFLFISTKTNIKPI